MKTVIRHGVIALVVSSASIIPATAQTPAEPPVKTFRSATDLVSIQASVRDKRGRPLNSLKTTDFEVLDNGQVRPILSLRADRLSPVSLAILVDMSGSMAVASKMEMARQAYATLLSQLRDGQDEVAVFTFDSALHQRQQFTSDLGSIRSALDEFNPFGTTSLYDATAATARHVASRSATHKAIIILTDGIDTSSSLTAPQVSGLASSIDVPVYVVATLPAMDETAIKEAAGRQTPSDRAPTCAISRSGRAVNCSSRAASRKPRPSRRDCSTNCASATCSPSKPPASTSGAASKSESSTPQPSSRRAADISAGRTAGSGLSRNRFPQPELRASRTANAMMLSSVSGAPKNPPPADTAITPMIASFLTSPLSQQTDHGRLSKRPRTTPITRMGPDNSTGPRTDRASGAGMTGGHLSESAPLGCSDPAVTPPCRPGSARLPVVRPPLTHELRPA